jgi:hypothetical protein
MALQPWRAGTQPHLSLVLASARFMHDQPVFFFFFFFIIILRIFFLICRGSGQA